MSNEIERMFASLSADADSTPVMEATTLRTRTNRRAAAQTGLAGAALVAVVAGTAFGGQWLLAGQGRPLAPPGSSVSATPPTGATPSTRPSSTSSIGTPPSNTPSSNTPSSSTQSSNPPSSGTPTAAIPKTIPARAFLTKADLNDSSGYNEPSGDEVALPSFCGADFASDDSIGVRSTLRAFYRRPGEEVTNVPDGVMLQTVTVYKADGATEFMADLRAAVDGCAKETDDGNQDDEYRTLEPVDVGDDAVRIEVKYEAEASPDSSEKATFTQQISAVRAGDAVTILRTSGYENFSADDAAVVTMTRSAHKNLTAWR